MIVFIGVRFSKAINSSGVTITWETVVSEKNPVRALVALHLKCPVNRFAQQTAKLQTTVYATQIIKNPGFIVIFTFHLHFIPDKG